MKNATLVALALSLALAACSDSNTGTVSFALTARQAAAPAASAAFSNAAAAPSVAAAGDSTVIMLGQRLDHHPERAARAAQGRAQALGRRVLRCGRRKRRLRRVRDRRHARDAAARQRYHHAAGVGCRASGYVQRARVRDPEAQ